MADKTFFDESGEQSVVKSTIVSKYFWAWANVIIPSAKRRSNRIAYIDLFAGPGRYRDGTMSTPLLVLQQAVANTDMREMLVPIFNDRDADSSKSLQKGIDSIPSIESLRHPPQVHNEEVGDDIVKMFEDMTLVPTLFFVDPWGYKGLSLRLVNSVLKDWGCDCIFFFNYNRINMGLTNPMVEEHMAALFGEGRVGEMQATLKPLDPVNRELTVIESLSEALLGFGGKYVLPFRFRNSSGARTSHHLIFVSKHLRGYEIMKGIMAKESSEAQQGVPSFEYNPASRKYPLLFELSRPLDHLEGLLLDRFAGRRLSMRTVYERHNVGTPYIKSNYKEVLKKLEREARIEADPPMGKRRKDTFADSVMVAFPRKEL